MKKFNKNYLVYGGLFLISLAIVLGLYFFINPSQDASKSVIENPIFAKSKMKEFDIQSARKLMDKDNDGKCDYCGMDVNLCIDSGMLECTMNPEAKIGILGSEHIHADFKVYLNGEKVDFNQGKYFVKSAFVHVEPEKNSEETGNVLHIHAKGVPLGLFFESIELGLPESAKVYVNSELNSDGLNYVPKDLDKILISYWSDDKVNEQLNSITDYAKNH